MPKYYVANNGDDARSSIMCSMAVESLPPERETTLFMPTMPPSAA